eukprot:1156520-Pelagomonas_calceolata.AAC.1
MEVAGSKGSDNSNFLGHLDYQYGTGSATQGPRFCRRHILIVLHAILTGQTCDRMWHSCELAMLMGKSCRAGPGP